MREEGGIREREEKKASEGYINEQVSATATGAQLTAQNTPLIALPQGKEAWVFILRE